MTGYQESPGLDMGMSIGSAESPRRVSVPDVPSDAGRDSAEGDFNKENRPLPIHHRSPRSICAPHPVPYLQRVLQSRTIESRASSPEA